MNNIFEERENIQPYEYPQLLDYVTAIHESFWTADHFTYDRDVLSFKTQLKPHEQNAVKRAMLAIGVVENKVKTFWSRIDMRLPKPEIADVGHTFGGNEVIHKLAYERLLNLLGLSKEFETIMQEECMKGRAKYLTTYLKGVSSRSDKEFTKSLILFTLLVENASLFSQFLTIASFNKYRGQVLSNFSSVVMATAREESLHGQFGAELIKIIREENPDWFDQEMEDKIRRSIRKAYRVESEVLDWIFEEGELDFMPKEIILEYLKKRLNHSLHQIGYEPEYDLDQELLEKTQFFDNSIKCSVSFDFFNDKGIDYAKTNLITDEDWD